ncbi:hypothetical protein LTR20_004859 [Exophiala xenobiotica]|nr:hypothetical protein LTR90_004870 [Exophiala xenobiotica]KAK5464153.1 hypothetical protein LTR20_004859 [Exophiala xenobiotica]KAK5497913.1 hypothetical protein LTR26_001313 [Exophiala xenobiotica]KAK5503711.1 hypothetical protein LTR83_001636 [Exophiala xenobiotica]KAK5516202.1 hypothetical protein LTR21_003888 [Exophiala xenobiotica]
MAAEAVTFTPIVAEAAGDVILIVETLAVVSNFANSLKQKRDDSAAILKAIKDMENELKQVILEVEYRTYYGAVYAASGLWYERDRGRVNENGLTRKSLGLDLRPTDEEEAKGWGALNYLPSEVRSSIRDLTKAMAYFAARPIPPVTDSPSVLSTIVLCTTLLVTLTLLEARIYDLSSDASNVTENNKLALQALNDAYTATGKWETGYLANRRKGLHLKQQLETEFVPPRLVGYLVTSDTGKADEFLPNFAGKEYPLEFTVNDGSSDHGIIDRSWKGSPAGKALHSLQLAWVPIFDRNLGRGGY